MRPGTFCPAVPCRVNKSIGTEYLQDPALPPAEYPREAELGLPFPGRKRARDSASRGTGRSPVPTSTQWAQRGSRAPPCAPGSRVLIDPSDGPSWITGPKPPPDEATRREANSGEKFRMSHLPSSQEVMRWEDRTPSRAYAGPWGEVVMGTGYLSSSGACPAEFPPMGSSGCSQSCYPTFLTFLPFLLCPKTWYHSTH